MDIEAARQYCLSLPLVTEDMPFGEDVLVFRIFNKIFSCLNLSGKDCITIKCDPDYALELRDQYSEIIPAYHWNKKYWNQMPLNGTLKSDIISSLIRHGYSETVKKLPKKIKIENPVITEIVS